MRRAPRLWRWLWRAVVAAVALPVLAGVAWLAFLGRPPAPPPLPPPLEPDNVERAGWPSLTSAGPPGFGACIRALAIDGGGMRGIIPALILDRIEQRTGKPVATHFDLIVGTSTGSILALGLTRPSDADARKPAFTAREIVQLFKDNASRIFPTDFALLRSIQQIFRPKYRAQEIEAVFERYFGDVQLFEAVTAVAVPAYDIQNGRRIWFGEGGHAGLLMKDIVRGATAVPTYFPPVRLAVQKHEVQSGYVTLVDGALFANNPAQDALAFAQKMRPKEDPSLMLVSVGTGRSERKYSFESTWGWGTLGWIDPLLEIALSDPAVEFQTRRLAALSSAAYFRFQPNLGDALLPLDASSPRAIDHLTTAAERYLEEPKARRDLDTLVSELELPRSSRCKPIGKPYERRVGPRKRPGGG